MYYLELVRTKNWHIGVTTILGMLHYYLKYIFMSLVWGTHTVVKFWIKAGDIGGTEYCNVHIINLHASKFEGVDLRVLWLGFNIPSPRVLAARVWGRDRPWVFWSKLLDVKSSNTSHWRWTVRATWILYIFYQE